MVSVFVAYESVGLGRRLRHAVAVVGADVFSHVGYSREHSRLRVMLGTAVVPGALADGVGVHLVYLLVTTSGAEQPAWLLAGTP